MKKWSIIDNNNISIFFIITYLYNILLYSKNRKKYIKNINLILEYLYQIHLYLKLEKYKFNRKKIEFLSFIIRENRIYINLNKIQTIKNYKIVTNIKKL